MQKVKFSFIIPTKDEGDYIESCLKSMKRQKIEKNSYEIIVVDSYSEDKTVKIARKYTKKVLFEKRKGPGIARNSGAKKARGEILIFADADVRFQKDFLKQIREKFAKNIGGGICKLVLYDNKKPSQNKLYSIWINAIRFLVSLGFAITNGCCFIYKKNAFNKVGGFDPKLLTGEDHELARRVAKIKRFRFFNDTVVYTSMRRVYKYGFLAAMLLFAKATLLTFLKHRSYSAYWQKPSKKQNKS